MKTLNKITTIRTQIYPFKERAYDNAFKRLKEWNGSPENKAGLKKFGVYLALKRDKKRRIIKLIPELMKIADWSGKNLDDFTIQDVEQVIADIHNNEKWQEATKSDYVRAIKTYYLWREDTDERISSLNAEQQLKANQLYKYIHKHVKTTYKHKEIDHSLIITQEDFDVLIRHCQSPLEEAVLATFFFTGVRVDELLNIRIMDFQVEDKCAMLRVIGKTGQRRIPVLEGIPFVMKWINCHPDKSNPEALLFVSLNNRFRFQPLRYMGIHRMLERIWERAGYIKREEPTPDQVAKKIRPRIKWQLKPCNPHWIRHSCATKLAPKYKESILCDLMGWVAGSDQSRVYVHLAASQVKEAVLQANGIEPEKRNVPEMIKCVCGALTAKPDKYCYRCYKPLTVETAIEDTTVKNQAITEAMQFIIDMTTKPDRLKSHEIFEEQLKKIQQK